MERNAYILFALLIATSSAALYVHQTNKDDTAPEAAVTIWDVRPGEVTSFSFSSDTFQIEVVPKKDRFGTFWNAKSRRKILQAALKNPNHKFGQIDRDTTLVTEDSKVQNRSKDFVLGLTGRSFLENIAPLRVKTIIGNTDNRENEFGFEERVGKFTIEAGMQKRSYEIGNTGYGSRVRYIKDEDGKIYAMEDRLLSMLFSADTKFEGKIVFARESEHLISFAITSQSPPLLLKQKRGSKKSYWTINNGTEESIQVQSWIESKLLTMTGEGFVPEQLRPENLETLLEFEMEIRGVDQKIKGKLFRKNSVIRPVYFLQSDLTRRLVKMNTAQVVDLIASVNTLTD